METLEQRRNFLLTNYNNLKEVLIFVTSNQNFNPIKFQNATVLDILEIIDFALIKIFADLGLSDKLKAFFTNNKIY